MQHYTVHVVSVELENINKLWVDSRACAHQWHGNINVHIIQLHSLPSYVHNRSLHEECLFSHAIMLIVSLQLN